MRREENWAIEEGRIRTFFAAQPDVTQTAKDSPLAVVKSD